jgi:hypothetical protein
MVLMRTIKPMNGFGGIHWPKHARVLMYPILLHCRHHRHRYHHHHHHHHHHDRQVLQWLNKQWLDYYMMTITLMINDGGINALMRRLIIYLMICFVRVLNNGSLVY